MFRLTIIIFQIDQYTSILTHRILAEIASPVTASLGLPGKCNEAEEDEPEVLERFISGGVSLLLASIPSAEQLELVVLVLTFDELLEESLEGVANGCLP